MAWQAAGADSQDPRRFDSLPETGVRYGTLEAVAIANIAVAVRTMN
ncbi:hypothetical protein LZ518_09245 [Sphingomonas sp. RB56-2]|uniref:Uncharacterized protein n=1 Tax=Sphingomonas brevis TaxID=2908206 RepID=A0ABT0SAE0_9SPHN|nr:hypothetical protein [Sphingomonas brevis]MCL6741312.1 hypothetical protein [Sphingomonas brevis]